MPNQLIKSAKDLDKLKKVIQILNFFILEDIKNFIKNNKATDQDFVHNITSYNHRFELIDKIKDLVNLKNYQTINHTINQWKQSADSTTQAYAKFIDYYFQAERAENRLNKKFSPQS